MNNFFIQACGTFTLVFSTKQPKAWSHENRSFLLLLQVGKGYFYGFKKYLLSKCNYRDSKQWHDYTLLQVLPALSTKYYNYNIILQEIPLHNGLNPYSKMKWFRRFHWSEFSLKCFFPLSPKTYLRMATVVGVTAINVKTTAKKKKIRNKGKTVHCVGHFPGIAS